MFKPNYTGTLTLAANGVSQSINLPNGGGPLIRVKNAGPNIAYIEFTSNANTPASVAGASGGGYPVFANMAAEELMIPAGTSCIAAISAGTSSISFSRGDLT